MGWMETIGDAVQYIEENITQELTPERIAKHVNLSPFYFQKGFAMLCGKPRNSRQVGYGLRENLAGEGIPAFRIVNGRGELSGAFYFTIPDLQKPLLEEEGVPVNWDGRIWSVDLKKYGWATTAEDAAAFAAQFQSKETAG